MGTWISSLLSLIDLSTWWSSSTQPVQEPAAAAEAANGEESQQNEGEKAAENVEEPVVEPDHGANPAASNTKGDDESDMWEETFKSHTDSKPYGLCSIHDSIS